VAGAADKSSYALTSSDIGSLTFFGGSSALSFTLTTESSSTSQCDLTVDTSSMAGAEWESSLALFGIGVGNSGSSTATLTFSRGNHKVSTSTKTNTVAVTFADPDLGDQFQVEVRKDPVFGGPVYRLLGGQTRCAWEQGSVSRDDISMALVQSTFEHVNPYSSISTVLEMSNNSPTGDTFTYDLTLLLDTSRYGLIMAMNGHVLGSTAVSFDIAAGETLRMTLDIDKGSNGYSFEGVTLKLQGNAPGSGDCAAVQTKINVLYDEPCARIDFAGNLAANPSFLVNSRSTVNMPNGAAALAVMVRNPEVSVLGRRWLDQAGETAMHCRALGGD